eukprot:1446308-Rhodomonas_salina.4
MSGHLSEAARHNEEQKLHANTHCEVKQQTKTYCFWKETEIQCTTAAQYNADFSEDCGNEISNV